MITVKFTKAELWELQCLLANGVFEHSDPANKVAASAYDKICDAHSKAHRAALRQKEGEA